jgi:hypothetical protein
MGILDVIRKVTASFANQRAERTELEYLRTVYQNKTDNIRPRQWYRVANENGDVVGFSFACACGTEYQLLNVNLWLGHAHKCPQCTTPFDLLKDAGIKADTPHSKFTEKFATFPIRPRLLTAKKTPYVDTWAQSSDDNVKWDGPENYAGLGGLEYSDPLAFSKHGR